MAIVASPDPVMVVAVIGPPAIVPEVVMLDEPVLIVPKLLVMEPASSAPTVVTWPREASTFRVASPDVRLEPDKPVPATMLVMSPAVGVPKQHPRFRLSLKLACRFLLLMPQGCRLSRQQ